ncbi:MAG: mechanosensitive ion channel family protein [Rhodothermales bacterium]
MRLSEFVQHLSSLERIVFFIVLAVAAQFLVRGLQRLSERLLTPRGGGMNALMQRHPKVVTITTILVSALTFTIYFLAIGLILQEFNISLKAYLASASVIGLAVGFGSQGLVQDVVIGLTLIFSDVLDVGDVVDLSGQSGRVERIGLRFTVLVNLFDQRVYVPNRNISQINRYRAGAVRAFVDVQLPEGTEPAVVSDVLAPLAQGMRAQHRALVLSEPELSRVRQAGPDAWRYLRITFSLWPGQNALLETTFKQRTLAAMKALDPDYQDWMITVTYRAE